MQKGALFVCSSLTEQQRYHKANHYGDTHAFNDKFRQCRPLLPPIFPQFFIRIPRTPYAQYSTGVQKCSNQIERKFKACRHNQNMFGFDRL